MIKITVLILILIITTVTAEDFLYGERTPKDLLIHKEINVKYPVWFAIRSSDVAFPQYFENNSYNITAIKVTDNLYDNGYAEIDYGGPGYTFVNVHLRSRRGRGFHFTVEVYGVPNKF